MPTIKPLEDVVVIRRLLDDDPMSPGGIILPTSEDAQETPYRGEVIAAGPGKHFPSSAADRELRAAARLLIAQPESHRAWARLRTALAASETQRPSIPMSVNVGDTVVFSRNGHQEFRVGGEEVIVCREASIMGVLE